MSSEYTGEMLALVFACVTLTDAECQKPKDAKILYDCATEAAFHGDLDRAAALIASQIPQKKPEDEFWSHNELAWIRWAQGDIGGAFVETELQRSTAMKVKNKKSRVGLLLHALWDK